MATPSSTISPPLKSSSRFTQRSSVVFPEPLAPMIDTTSPLFTSRSTPFRISTGPKLLVSPRMARSVIRPSLKCEAAAGKFAEALDHGVDQKIEKAAQAVEFQG